MGERKKERRKQREERETHKEQEGKRTKERERERERESAVAATTLWTRRKKGEERVRVGTERAPKREKFSAFSSVGGGGARAF